MKFSGCNLDVLSEAEARDLQDCFSRQRLKKRLEDYSVGEWFFRNLVVSVPYRPTKIASSGIDHFLDGVDAYFNQLAQTIGATVVPHEWVLAPDLREVYAPRVIERLGIAGHQLLARVQKTAGEKMTLDKTPNYMDYQTQLQSFTDSFFEENGWHVLDSAWAYQFISDPATSIHLSGTVLVDIEPRVIDFRR